MRPALLDTRSRKLACVAEKIYAFSARVVISPGEGRTNQALKIAHFFNVANDGWSVVKGLRGLDVDAHLILRRPDHVGSLPQWEEAEIDLDRLVDLYDPDWDVLDENWTVPPYVHVWDVRRETRLLSALGSLSKTFRRKLVANALLRSLQDLERDMTGNRTRTGSSIVGNQHDSGARVLGKLGERWLAKCFYDQVHKYDLVIGHAPFARFAPLYSRIVGKPYVLYDAGWIHYLHESAYPRYDEWKTARWGYKNAAAILMSNVDTLHIFEINGYDLDKIFYTPFAIDTHLYRPRPELELSQDAVFFQPSRPEKLKASDNFLYAFSKYIKRKPSAKLWLVNWGKRQPDWQEHLRLISELGIANKITWMPVMNKRRLIECYNIATVTVDQFGTGGLGTLTPEAMACGRPVIAYVNPDMWLSTHGSVPPVASARSPDEIYDAMISLEDPSVRQKFGNAGRKWVEETCSLEVVAKLQLGVYEKVVGSDI